jgi:hypothetical protein
MIPTTEDLASDKLVHKFGDMFNPPGLTNFWGAVQADIDLTGIRSLNFPPFTNSDFVTAGLFLNKRYFPSLGANITFQWFPDRIEREASYEGISLKSTTVIPFGKKALLIKLIVKNNSGVKKDITLSFGLSATITKNLITGNSWRPPHEDDNEATVESSRGAVIFKAKHSKACSIQGLHPKADNINIYRAEKTLRLADGETKALFYINVIEETVEEALDSYDAFIANPGSEITKVTEQWNSEINSIFEKNNNSYSGHLPILYTDDEDIKRLYYTSILGVVYFRRDNPFSVYGRAYDTLMPRYWQTTTFIWDYHLSSTVHAILDPAVMKKYSELWMKTNLHSHFGTEYLTGGTVGPWYSVNDFGLIWIANEYLRWNGDFDWLDKIVMSPLNIEYSKVIDHLLSFALSWRSFKTQSGLADYGRINNLLECVSTYIHEVASLNAGNIFSLRTLAEILRNSNAEDRSKIFIGEAQNILRELQSLYSEGNGYWNARFPDSRLVEIRHCYDFITILNTIPDDLTSSQKDEMTQFFVNELQTPKWMRALSPADTNSMFSVRPDHQWNGAYTAWPALAAKGLYNIGKTDIAFKWLKGLAKSANQGPFGQGHFVESAVTPESGGATKSFPEWPYATDWLCSSNGSFTNVIIEGIFGVRASLFNGISASSNFGDFDSKAELTNLKYQGKLYNVTKNGLKT